MDHLDGRGEHYQTEHLIYVCAICDEQLEGDPELDRHEAMAEAAADNWRQE